MIRLNGKGGIKVVGLIAAWLACGSMVMAAAPGNLDELLEQTRTAREAEAKANAAREARFLTERNRQVAMMSEARSELAVQRQRSAQLSASFDANEKRLTEMQGMLDSRAGNLGEMFGVVRQVAGDFSSVVSNSIISAQYPDRTEFVSKLAQSRSLPSMADLERFWFELQREMTETGKVVKFKTKSANPEGKSVDATVTRMGPFSATSSGDYMVFLPSQKQLSVMARQPGSKYNDSAQNLESRTSGYSPGMIDPTRGTLLSIYAQRPTLMERIDKGEAVGYVILLVGFIGAGVGLFQLFHLAMVRAKVRNQLKFPKDPQQDNPLGRVLATFKGPDTETLERTTEVVELRISEAVQKEVPTLERFQSFLRLAVAAGPLLGLIGTVVGMILTFQSITESGSSDPKLMAAGISQAMIATVLGLGIAIPLLFINAWLVSMSKSIVQVLDEQSSGLLAERLELIDKEVAHV
jgi:biopolymer transport protein ExbB